MFRIPHVAAAHTYTHVQTGAERIEYGRSGAVAHRRSDGIEDTTELTREGEGDKPRHIASG